MIQISEVGDEPPSEKIYKNSPTAARKCCAGFRKFCTYMQKSPETAYYSDLQHLIMIAFDGFYDYDTRLSFST